MELKTARLTLLIDPAKKAAFERLCAQLDLTASQVVRQMIRDFLAEHGVSYRAGSAPAVAAGPHRAKRAAARGPARAAGRPGAKTPPKRRAGS